MVKRLTSRLPALFALILLVVFWVIPVSAAPRDRIKPTTPTNFRVTAKTPFSVSLAWNPSTDNSGNFTYILASTAGSTVTLPKTATSYTWSGLAPRNTYTFIIYARDAAGNNSSSVSVSTTLPPDTVAPAAPVLSVTDVGPSYVSLAWTAALDDGPHLFYRVYLNGSLYTGTGRDTFVTLHLLQPETTYTFNVQAYDYGPNYSPLSNTVTVTTAPNNPDDVTPPTTPTNLNEQHWGDGEIHLTWNQSTDDQDPQANIRYNVFVNGVLNDIAIGTGFSIVYGTLGVDTVDVVAVDTSGNESAPATIIVDFSQP